MPRLETNGAALPILVAGDERLEAAVRGSRGRRCDPVGRGLPADRHPPRLSRAQRLRPRDLRRPGRHLEAARRHEPRSGALRAHQPGDRLSEPRDLSRLGRLPERARRAGARPASLLDLPRLPRPPLPAAVLEESAAGPLRAGPARDRPPRRGPHDREGGGGRRGSAPRAMAGARGLGATGPPALPREHCRGLFPHRSGVHEHAPVRVRAPVRGAWGRPDPQGRDPESHPKLQGSRRVLLRPKVRARGRGLADGLRLRERRQFRPGARPRRSGPGASRSPCSPP